MCIRDRYSLCACSVRVWCSVCVCVVYVRCVCVVCGVVCVCSVCVVCVVCVCVWEKTRGLYMTYLSSNWQIGPLGRRGLDLTRATDGG